VPLLDVTPPPEAPLLAPLDAPPELVLGPALPKLAPPLLAPLLAPAPLPEPAPLPPELLLAPEPSSLSLPPEGDEREPHATAAAPIASASAHKPRSPFVMIRPWCTGRLRPCVRCRRGRWTAHVEGSGLASSLASRRLAWPVSSAA
jgi:hypothetical protein